MDSFFFIISPVLFVLCFAGIVTAIAYYFYDKRYRRLNPPEPELIVEYETPYKGS